MDGILIIDKPQHYTSHDVINIVRKVLKTKKVGHTGTLDPDASGVLVIGVNKGTKIMQYLNQDNKKYLARICIGRSTDTLDKTGSIIKESKVEPLDNVDQVIASFKGSYTQIPPMYSAIKYKGKKLYEYARQGIEIKDRPSRDIQIFDINRTSELDYKDDCLFFDYEVKGSKGLYVRTLSYDIGQALGHEAHNYDLRRLEAGKFDINMAVTLQELEEGHCPLISLSDALDHLPSIQIHDGIRHHVKNGMAISIKEFEAPVLTKIIDDDNNLLAIYDKHPTEYKMKAQNVFYKE
jgi:tRNA pseudouridine55 synthase